MKRKLLARKWMLLALSVVLLVASLCLVAPVSAADGPVPIDTTMKIEPPWGANSYFDMYLACGDIARAGFCADLYGTLLPYATCFPTTVYDYFAFREAGTPMPAAITAYTPMTWEKIAWIINNKDGYDKYAVQHAIWYFTNGDWPFDKPAALALIAAADASGGMVPGFDDVRPMVCYTVLEGNVYQLSFYEEEPGTPPVPEMPAVGLFGIGLVGLAGLGLFGYRKTHPVRV
jgi:hypothetical protein